MAPSTPTIPTPGFIEIPSAEVMVGDILKLWEGGRSFLIRNVATTGNVITFTADPAPGYNGRGWVMGSRVGERGFLVDSVQHEEVVLGVKF